VNVTFNPNDDHHKRFGMTMRGNHYAGCIANWSIPNDAFPAFFQGSLLPKPMLNGIFDAAPGGAGPPNEGQADEC